MKNLIRAFGTALVISGVFAITSASAQTTPTTTTKTTTTKSCSGTKACTDKVIGKDASGNTVYKCSKGNYYLNDKNAKVMEPKGAKITPVSKS